MLQFYRISGSIFAGPLAPAAKPVGKGPWYTYGEVSGCGFSKTCNEVIAGTVLLIEENGSPVARAGE
jgi:hypothetical protein